MEMNIDNEIKRVTLWPLVRINNNTLQNGGLMQALKAKGNQQTIKKLVALKKISSGRFCVSNGNAIACGYS